MEITELSCYALKQMIIDEMDLNAIEDPKERAAKLEKYFRRATTNGNRSYILDSRALVTRPTAKKKE